MTSNCEICGKEIDPEKTIGFIHNSAYHGFCSNDCRKKYRKINNY